MQYCNGIFECSDDSDELDCNKTMVSKPGRKFSLLFYLSITISRQTYKMMVIFSVELIHDFGPQANVL